ncbi:TonB-dependent receptor plug domain-containing protein [Tenacibaculum finnmarkense]|nr:TonB-dependent receptor plug domain-containing protein [Tenacibaculum finnmarkense]
MLSQKKQDLTITIIDKTTHKVLPNAHVSIGRKHAYTNLNGNAIFHQIFNQISEEISEEKSPKKLLKITHVGYVNYQKTVDFSKKNALLIIAITPDNAILNEVIITQKPVKNFIKYSGNKQKINTEFLAQNRDNSLMQTLQNIPGVSAITIGSGQSKPTIRGLGFNRVVSG